MERSCTFISVAKGDKLLLFTNFKAKDTRFQMRSALKSARDKLGFFFNNQVQTCGLDSGFVRMNFGFSQILREAWISHPHFRSHLMYLLSRISSIVVYCSKFFFKIRRQLWISCTYENAAYVLKQFISFYIYFSVLNFSKISVIDYRTSKLTNTFVVSVDPILLILILFLFKNVDVYSVLL